MVKLLLVEDDEILGFMIKDGLEMIGDYNIIWCVHPQEALDVFDSFCPDILVSDLEMPGMTGLELVKKIRERNTNIPVILETGVSAGKTVVEAYSLGIDNYIKKPFLPAELDAYIQGLMRRINQQSKPVAEPTEQQAPVDPSVLLFGKMKFNLKTQILETPFKRSELSVTETLLLELLIRNKSTLVTKEKIAEVVWGGNKFMNNQSLDVFLHNLRKYLSDDPNITIKTVRGIGYILEVLG